MTTRTPGTRLVPVASYTCPTMRPAAGRRMTTELSAPGTTVRLALPMRGKKMPALVFRSTPALIVRGPVGTPVSMKRPFVSVRTITSPPATSAFTAAWPLAYSTLPLTRVVAWSVRLTKCD